MTETAARYEINSKDRTDEVLPLVVRESGLITADVIRQMEAQVEGLNKIKSISIKLTNSSDWMMMDGKPCLANSGCMKIANLWGVSFNSPEVVSENIKDDKGEYVLFTCSGKAEFRGRTVEDIGTSSTRDKLLGRVGGNLRPLADVDLPSVKKMAVTNWQTRILKKILGLSFEAQDLANAGITPKSVDHKGSEAPKSGTVVTITSVQKFEGKNKTTGKAYTKYSVTDSTGAKYDTFSVDLAEDCRLFKESNAKVVINYAVNKFGNELKSVTAQNANEPEQAEEPKE